jgi:hypothetical protein
VPDVETRNDLLFFSASQLRNVAFGAEYEGNQSEMIRNRYIEHVGKV